MAQQKKGLITRLLEGKERSEEYARSTLPTNRWQLFWDIFKGNFSKIITVNLLTLIFFVPLIAVIVLALMYKSSSGVTGGYGADIGIGYPAAFLPIGTAEGEMIMNDFLMYLCILVSSVIAAVGLAGGMYVVRNMVWTEGIFVANDFWRGVKLNYKNALQTAVFFCAILLLSTTMINMSEYTLVQPNIGKFQVVMIRISQGTSWVMITLSAMMAFWMIALGVNYNMKLFQLFRNAFVMTIGTFPQTVFFGVIALLPFLLFFVYNIIPHPIVILVAAGVCILFGIAFALLVWLDFAQWVFDKYINPKIQGAKVGRGIFNKDGSSALSGDDSKAELEYQRIILAHGRSRLVARPIKPIDDSLQVYELPQAFTREDLKKLRNSKENIAEDTEAYAEEHKNDLRYVEYNRQFDERQKELDALDKKRKAKPKKPPKMKSEEKED